MKTMAPNHQSYVMNSLSIQPVSRTYQYRKVMKPLLERKRRARINKCLDELKDLMTGALQAEGENVSKLEKADILELTVRHLHRLKEKNSLFLQSNPLKADKYWEGYQHCAGEVSQFLTKYDRNISSELMRQISGFEPKNYQLNQWSNQRVPAAHHNSEIFINRCHLNNTSNKYLLSSDGDSNHVQICKSKEDVGGVWRPW